MRFNQDLFFDLNVLDQTVMVRLTTSNEEHRRLANYGDCDIYMHLTTKEQKINGIIFEQFQVIYDFLNDRKQSGKKKDRPYKIKITTPPPESISLYLRRTNSTKDLPINFLIELIDRLLDYLDYELDVNKQDDISENYVKKHEEADEEHLNVYNGQTSHSLPFEDESSNDDNFEYRQNYFNQNKEQDSDEYHHDYLKEKDSDNNEYPKNNNEQEEDNYNQSNFSNYHNYKVEEDEEKNPFLKNYHSYNENEEENENSMLKNDYDENDYQEPKQFSQNFFEDEEESEIMDEKLNLNNVDNLSNNYDEEQAKEDIDSIQKRFDNEVFTSLNSSSTDLEKVENDGFNIPLINPDDENNYEHEDEAVSVHNNYNSFEKNENSINFETDEEDDIFVQSLNKEQTKKYEEVKEQQSLKEDCSSSDNQNDFEDEKNITAKSYEEEEIDHNFDDEDDDDEFWKQSKS